MTEDIPSLLAAVDQALPRRDDLQRRKDQTAYRLFHGYGEGVVGLEIDRLGDVAVVTHHEEHVDALPALVERLQAIGLATVVARPRRRSSAPTVVAGELETDEIEVLDGGLRFGVEPLDVRNAGLYLDARPARAWIRAHAEGRRVLNLFAFTGSLGVAAAAGGATSVVQVEQQKRAVQRLVRNHARNELPIDARDALCTDLYPWLRRQARDGRSFDAIVLDPPPQVPGRQRGRGQDYPRLARLAGEVLAPGGWLLCLFSRYQQCREAYETEVREACPHVLDVLWRGTSGDDFPETDPDHKLRMTAFVRA